MKDDLTIFINTNIHDKSFKHNVVSCRNQATKILGPYLPDKPHVRVNKQKDFFCIFGPKITYFYILEGQHVHLSASANRQWKALASVKWCKTAADILHQIYFMRTTLQSVNLNRRHPQLGTIWAIPICIIITPI